MIELNTLKNNVVAKLEAINQDFGYNYAFHIVADTGSYKKPVRINNTVTEYVQGVFSVVNSDVSELTGGVLYATQTCNLQIEISLPNHEDDREYNGTTIIGSGRKITEIRNILDRLAQNNDYDEIEDTDGLKYLATVVYSFASGGQRNQIAQDGDSYTFSMFVYYSFVQNGINSRNVVFYLDGVPFPYQAVSINRAKTFDGNVYGKSNFSDVQNTPIQANWSGVFDIPLLKGGVYEHVINFLTADEPLNTVHILTYTLGGKTYTKLVSIGEITLNAETIKNVALKVPFYDAVQNYLQVSFPKGFYLYATNESRPFTLYSKNEEMCSYIIYDLNFTLEKIGTLGESFEENPYVSLSKYQIVISTAELNTDYNSLELIKQIS